MYRVAVLGLPFFCAIQLAVAEQATDGFSRNVYESISAELQNGVVGQWVVIIERVTVRSDLKNADLPQFDVTATLRSFLIRQLDSEVQAYEMSDCEGGFRPLELQNGMLISDVITAYQESKNRYTYETSGTRYVPLSSEAGFTETFDYTAQYYRVSDRTDGMGSLTRNWSDTDGDTTQMLTCYAVERAANDFHSILLAGDSEGVVYMTSNSVPSVPDAIVTTEDPERSIMNFFGLGEQSFSFSENNDERASLTFYADDNDGLSVSGSAEVAIIPPAEIAITPPAVAER